MYLHTEFNTHSVHHHHPSSVAWNAFCGVTWRSKFINSSVQNLRFITRITPSTSHTTFWWIQGKIEYRLDVLNNTHSHTRARARALKGKQSGILRLKARCAIDSIIISSVTGFMLGFELEKDRQSINTEACSRNHSCRAKGIIIKYYDYKSAGLYYL
jgi:hypothetical protein